MVDTIETQDVLTQAEVKRCKSAIETARSSYSPGLEKYSPSGVPYFIYGEYLWVYLGFTPCEFARTLLSVEYDAVFGKIVQVEPHPNHGCISKDLGFTYGTPFVGIPLPK
jgi:hypothetical protein